MIPKVDRSYDATGSTSNRVSEKEVSLVGLKQIKCGTLIPLSTTFSSACQSDCRLMLMESNEAELSSFSQKLMCIRGVSHGNPHACRVMSHFRKAGNRHHVAPFAGPDGEQRNCALDDSSIQVR